MKDQSRAKQELLEENSLLKQKIQELEHSESELKLTEKKLRDAETHYRLLFEHSPDGILIIDPATARPLKFNETAHRQLGYSREEFARLSIYDLDVFETPDETMMRIKKIICEGRSDFETLHRTRQGEIRDIYVTAQNTEFLGQPVFHCVWRDITEPKKVEKSLRESEERFKLLVENAAYGIFVQTQYRFAYLNPEAVRLFGAESADQLLGQPVLDRVDSRFHDLGRERIRLLNEEKTAAPLLEQVFLRMDGSPFDVEVTALPTRWRDHDGSFVSFQEITERKRAKETLRENEEKYRTLIQNIQDGIYILDSFGNFTFVNDVIVKRSGFPAEWFLGRSYLDVIIEEDRERVQRYFNEVMDGKTNLYVLSYKNKFGNLLQVEVSTAPLFDGAKVIALLGISRDISERSRLEKELVRSEEKLRLITENMVDCVAWVDSSGTYQYVTPSYKEVLGYGPEEMVGISGFSLLHPEDLERVLTLYMNSIEQGLQAIHYETRIRNSNGRYIPLEVRARSLKDTEGKIIGGVLAARDITERKQAEEELEKYRKQLENMVKERTAELENKNITLQELNTALRVLLKQREDDKKEMEERFVLNVRNLVLPYVERIKKGPLDIAQRPYLDIIEAHLNEIATPLLKNLRQFNLTPKEMKVAALVRQGKSTKEIAEILRISTGSIDIHRKNIRKKLGLSNRKANLQSQLENFDQ